MDIPEGSPLLDSRWIKDIGDAVFNRLLGNEAVRIDRETEQRHKELITVHRDGWKAVAISIDGGLRAIADAIRDTRR